MTASAHRDVRAEPDLAHALLEQWPAAAILLDAGGGLRGLNRRARQWLAVGSGARTPRRWSDLALPWEIEPAVFDAVLRGEELRLPPAEIRDADGVSRNCEARLLPLSPGDGAAAALLLIEPARSAQVGSWEWDIRSDQTEIDAAWCRALDIDPCIGAGQREAWIRNIHPDDHAEFHRRIEALAERDVDQFEVEYRMLTRDFRWVWIMQRGRVIERDARGVPQRVSGIYIDIDTRKRGEVDLRESESRLANALWGARAALWHWHVPTDALTESPMWFAMTGYSSEDWHSVPDPWDARVHPDDREHVAAAVRAHLDGATQALEYEYRIRTAGGEWRWMLDRGRVVEWDLSGSPTVAIGVSLDIHAQKEAELRLRNSEARLQLALEKARGCVWEWHSEAGLDERSCDGYRALTGIDARSEGRRMRFWLGRAHSADRESIKHLVREVFEGGAERFETEHRIQHADGSWLWVISRGRVLERDAAGSVLCMAGVIVDVSETRRAEAALRRSELFHRSVVALTPGFGFEFRYDDDGKVRLASVSEGFEQVAGCTFEEFSRHDLSQMVLEAGALLGDAGYRLLQAGESIMDDACVRTPCGEVKWLYVAAHAVTDHQSGRVTGGIGWALDITERKRSEEQLRHSQSVLQTIASCSPSWLVLLDRDQTVLFINRAVQGVLPEDIVGKPLGQIDPEPGRGQFRAAVQRVIDTGEPGAYVHAVTGNDGRPRWFECHARAVVSDGRIKGAVINITDITQRRRAEAMLRTQARIVETMAEGVVLIDAADRIVLTNPAFDAMFGSGTAGLSGRSMHDLQGTEPIRCAPGSQEGAAHDATAFENEFLRPDGARFTASCLVTPVEIDGEVHRLAVLSDISIRKRMEREVLEIANREQQRIGSDLHDGLGQDLTGIALMLRSLATQVSGTHPPLRNDLEEVIGLVNDAVANTRDLASGLSPVSTSRGGLLAALQSLADRSIDRFGVKIELATRLRAPLALDDSRATHLYRIAQEAVTNAIRHGRAAHVFLELEGDEERVRLCVRDDGRGFAAAQPAAAGMGLKIMRYRSQVLRGDLTVRSAPSEGTQVECTCPQRTVD